MRFSIATNQSVKPASRKAIVIGGGIGGLSCACILAKEGIETILFEKNHTTGGLAGGFHHKGINFELGCNVSGPMNNEGALHRFVEYLEIKDNINPTMLDNDGCVVVTTSGNRIILPSSFNNFLDRISLLSPEDAKAIDEFGNKIKFIVKNLKTLNPGRYFEITSDIEKNILTDRTSLLEALSPIKNPTAKNLLSIFWHFTGTLPDQLPISLYAPLISCFLEGPCTISGHKLTEEMGKKLIASGGKIETSKKVIKIIINTDKVTGVQTEDGQIHEADFVISTIHPLETIKMLPPDNHTCRIKNRLQKAGETMGIFVSYFLVEADKLPEKAYKRWYLISENKFDYKNESDIQNFDSDDICLFVSNDFNESRRAILRAHIFMPLEFYKKWENTIAGKRSEEYWKMKETITEKIQEKIKNEFPELSPGLKHITSITSLTIRDYLGNYGGAFGILRSSKKRGLGTCHWKFPVHGLFLGGQSILYPGILGTIETSILICAEILGEKRLIERFG